MFYQTFSRRFRTHFWLKTMGHAMALSVFFVAYFYVLNHPWFTVRVMPLLGFDTWLPVVPWTVWVYFSLWVYICLPSSLMRTTRALKYYFLGALFLSLIGLSIFLFFPTAVPSREFDWNSHAALAFLKQSDATGNACPSFHVAFAVFSGLWLMTMLKCLDAGSFWQWANAGWCLAIVLSTMTTRQHVLLDVICGITLGAIAYGFNRWWSHRRKVVFL